MLKVGKRIRLIHMSNQHRANIKIGSEVKVVQKHHQRTHELTTGIVTKILTNSSHHPHGIKVMLKNGITGRVKEIIGKVD